MPQEKRLVIGKLGGVSNDGCTVVYDKENDVMLELRIPRYPEGTTIVLNKNGEWRADLSDTPENEAKKIAETENFYYAPRHFLPYKDYMYASSKFPGSCYTNFLDNPFFLADITREGSDVPLCSVPQIDGAIVLDTFEARLREMRYVMRHVLESNESRGNTWITYDEFNMRVRKLLVMTGHPLRTGSVKAYLRYYHDFIHLEVDEDDFKNSKLGLFSTYNRERIIHSTVERAIAMPTPFPRYNPTISSGASEEQAHAIKYLALRGGHISILTGGPGTGKTTILLQLVDNLLESYPDLNIYILAPTGKAVKRIKEVFGSREVEASTVHKFLGIGHTINKKDRERMQNADLVIVDESSMLDLDIFEKLISGINIDRAKLILVGDKDQLPPIGTGNIFADLIALGVYTEMLTINFRSMGGSVIDKNAKRINAGLVNLEGDDSFQVVEVSRYCTDYMAAMSSLNSVDSEEESGDNVVITPYRVERRLGSTEAVNKIVQSTFQKNQFGRIVPPSIRCFYPGDNVIMSHTDYNAGYFNGETGTVIGYLPDGGYRVQFDDTAVDVRNVEDMDLGYAITVHKSQGSEYETVDICIPEFNSFITRRMLYTAVTRGKKKVRIWTSSMEIIWQVILNNPEIQRNTWLAHFGKFY